MWEREKGFIKRVLSKRRKKMKKKEQSSESEQHPEVIIQESPPPFEKNPALALRRYDYVQNFDLSPLVPDDSTPEFPLKRYENGERVLSPAVLARSKKKKKKKRKRKKFSMDLEMPAITEEQE